MYSQESYKPSFSPYKGIPHKFISSNIPPCGNDYYNLPATSGPYGSGSRSIPPAKQESFVIDEEIIIDFVLPVGGDQVFTDGAISDPLIALMGPQSAPTRDLPMPMRRRSRPSPKGIDRSRFPSVKEEPPKEEPPKEEPPKEEPPKEEPPIKEPPKAPPKAPIKEKPKEKPKEKYSSCGGGLATVDNTYYYPGDPPMFRNDGEECSCNSQCYSGYCNTTISGSPAQNIYNAWGQPSFKIGVCGPVDNGLPSDLQPVVHDNINITIQDVFDMKEKFGHLMEDKNFNSLFNQCLNDTYWYGVPTSYPPQPLSPACMQIVKNYKKALRQHK